MSTLSFGISKVIAFLPSFGHSADVQICANAHQSSGWADAAVQEAQGGQLPSPQRGFAVPQKLLQQCVTGVDLGKQEHQKQPWHPQ